ncbi:FtsX-like permease family protein [compost metagenome]
MNLYTRALLYITRKKGKSLLLFLILLVIATFALAGISVKEASDTAVLNLRQSLGGGFTIERDTSDPSKWKTVETSNGGVSTVYQGEFLDRAMTEKVMKVKGINAYNATVRGYAELKNTDNTYLSPVIFENDIMAGNPGFEHSVTVMGQTNTEYSSFFVKGSFELTEGQHIHDGDYNTAMISQDLAETNDLSIGDKFILSLSESLVSDPVGAQSKVEVKIIGIFDPATEQVSQGFTVGINAVENMVLVDIDTSLKLYAWANEGYGSADYYVGDPAELEKVIQQVEKIESIDWTSFKITTNDKTYQSATEPLQNVSNLISILIIIIIIISVATLSLILAMWIKNRIHETGILMSIGISKVKIIMQYTVEIVIIAAIAFGVSYFSSNVVAQSVGDSLLEYTTSNTTKAESEQKVTNLYTDSAPEMEMSGSALAEIHVEVDPLNLLWIYFFGSMVIVLSVVIASIPILQLKPKQILSKMS